MRRLGFWLSLVLAACSSPSASNDGGSADSGATVDSGPAADAGPSIDAGPGVTDAGSSSLDAGTKADAGATASDGGGLSCSESCVLGNTSAFELFEGIELQSCACVSGAGAGNPICASSCTSECADPSTFTLSSACGKCLGAQEAVGSLCTLAAAGTCEGNASCESFAKCALGCGSSSAADAGSDAGGTDGGGTCGSNCAMSNLTAYVSFAGDQLQSCGCASGAPCESDCTSACASPSSLAMSSTCGICLQAQFSGTCTSTAAQTCAASSTCGAFTTCIGGCAP